MSTSPLFGRRLRRTSTGVAGAGAAVGLAMVLVAPMAFATAEDDTATPDETSVAATEPDAAEPDTTGSETTGSEPDTTESASNDAGEPETTESEPEASEPEASESEPEATEPEATESEPEATEPEATDLEATQPQPETVESDEAAACEGLAEYGFDLAASGEAWVTVTEAGCSSGATFNVSSFTLDQSAANESTVWGASNPTSVPQTIFSHGDDVVLPDAGTALEVGERFTGSVEVPACGDYQVDLYSGPEIDRVDLDNRVPGLRTGFIVLQDECEPAAFCPGIDDDIDYRTLFRYEYFAVNGGDAISLGTTVDWTDHVKVQRFTDENPDAIGNMMIRATVTLKSDVDLTTGEGCSYDFSLASYEAEGPTWETSGDQEFLGHDTDTVTADVMSIVLDVPMAECYGQSDLYKGSAVYSGDDSPNFPNAPISSNGEMIASWVGGSGCEEPSEEPTEPGTTPPSEEPSEEPTEPGTTPPSEEPSQEPSEEPTEPGTTPPSEEPTEPGTTPPSEEPSVQPSVVPSTTPASTPTSTPTTAVLGSRLADTGAEVTTVALLGGLLLLGGGGLVAAGTGGRRKR